MDTYLGALRTKLAAPMPIAPGSYMNPLSKLMHILGGGKYKDMVGENIWKNLGFWAKSHPGYAVGTGLGGLALARQMHLPIIGNILGGNQGGQ